MAELSLRRAITAEAGDEEEAPQAGRKVSCSTPGTAHYCRSVLEAACWMSSAAHHIQAERPNVAVLVSPSRSPKRMPGESPNSRVIARQSGGRDRDIAIAGTTMQAPDGGAQNSSSIWEDQQ